MEGTIEQEFKITFKTNLGNTYITTLDRELDVELYLDRVEECHGYHEMYEVSDSEIERAIDDFIENCDEELLLELANESMEEYPEDELAVKIVKIEVV